MILVGDIETNSLDISKDMEVWCIVLMNWETKEMHKFPPNRIVDALYMIRDCTKIVMHNYIRYDMQVLKAKYPKLPLPAFDDTLIMSRLFEPDRGMHSIESYGVECGIMKPQHEEWSEYSETMLHRCVEDVRILDYAYTKLMKERESHDWEEAIQLEYDVALAHEEQVKHGVLIDTEKAQDLISHLDEKISKLDSSIHEQLPLRCVGAGEVKRIFKKDGSYYKNVKEYFEL